MHTANGISQDKIPSTKMFPNNYNLFNYNIKLSNGYSQFNLCLIFIYYVKLCKRETSTVILTQGHRYQDLGKEL